VNLAEQGFTEPIDILDSRERYNPAQCLDGLGTSRLIKELLPLDPCARRLIPCLL
jgi:hypothetical protein